MRKSFYFFAIAYLIIQFGMSTSCKHDPVLDDLTPNPVDTIDPGDTTIVDPGDTTAVEVPCDPDVVYFDMQILPILNSNCAFSGCHDAASAQNGVVLESYESVISTTEVEPLDLESSDIYEVLTETDPDKRMPPSPANELPQEQIQLIATWISQGAEDLHCDEDATDCDTTAVTFSQIINSILQNNCVGCHSGAAPSGNVDLSSHAGVKSVAEDGRLVGVIIWDPNFPAMPQDGDQLSDCDIEKIQAWVAVGAPNN